MQRSPLITQKQKINIRAKTPQNGNDTMSRSKRETRSLIKAPVTGFQNNQYSLKKIQDKSSILQPFKLESIKENVSSSRVFYLGKGNNHEMVRKILLRRKNWVQTDNKDDFTHFKWAQSPWGFKYHTIGKQCICFNHYQYHRQISNKQRLVRNMINYCQSNKLNAFDYIPITYIIDLTTGEQQFALHNFLKFYNRNLPASNPQRRMQSILLPKSKHPHPTLPSSNKHPQGYFYCQYTMSRSFLLQDQTGKSPYLWILKPTFMNRGRGVALFNSLEEFQKLIWKYYQGNDLEDFADRNFNMDQFLEEDQKKELKEIVLEKIPIDKPNILHTQTNNQQIKTINEDSKDVAKDNINETNEILPITDRPKKQEAIKNSPQKAQNNSSITNASIVSKVTHEQKPLIVVNNSSSGLKVLSFVVQKYIQNPMLINQRKFDIRIWAMLTQNYQIYFFKQGYLRFSSFKYSTKQHTNPFIHLTNNSVQKHSVQYNQQSGNQIFLSQMKSYMSQSSYSKLQSKIRQIIWISLMSSRRKININGRKECFQIFGYDFMVDGFGKTWLIQVNTNPAIDDCSKVLKLLIPRMLDDAFALTIDKLFNNKINPNQPTYNVPNFQDHQNMWELLGDFNNGINEKTMGRKLMFLRR